MTVKRFYDSEKSTHTPESNHDFGALESHVAKIMELFIAEGYCPHEVAYQIACVAHGVACQVSVDHRLRKGGSL